MSRKKRNRVRKNATGKPVGKPPTPEVPNVDDSISATVFENLIRGRNKVPCVSRATSTRTTGRRATGV